MCRRPSAARFDALGEDRTVEPLWTKLAAPGSDRSPGLPLSTAAISAVEGSIEERPANKTTANTDSTATRAAGCHRLLDGCSPAGVLRVWRPGVSALPDGRD